VLEDVAALSGTDLECVHLGRRLSEDNATAGGDPNAGAGSSSEGGFTSVSMVVLLPAEAGAAARSSAVVEHLKAALGPTLVAVELVWVEGRESTTHWGGPAPAAGPRPPSGGDRASGGGPGGQLAQEHSPARAAATYAVGVTLGAVVAMVGIGSCIFLGLKQRPTKGGDDDYRSSCSHEADDGGSDQIQASVSTVDTAEAIGAVRLSVGDHNERMRRMRAQAAAGGAEPPETPGLQPGPRCGLEEALKVPSGCKSATPPKRTVRVGSCSLVSSSPESIAREAVGPAGSGSIPSPGPLGLWQLYEHLAPPEWEAGSGSIASAASAQATGSGSIGGAFFAQVGGHQAAGSGTISDIGSDKTLPGPGNASQAAPGPSTSAAGVGWGSMIAPSLEEAATANGEFEEPQHWGRWRRQRYAPPLDSSPARSTCKRSTFEAPKGWGSAGISPEDFEWEAASSSTPTAAASTPTTMREPPTEEGGRRSGGDRSGDSGICCPLSCSNAGVQVAEDAKPPRSLQGAAPSSIGLLGCGLPSPRPAPPEPEELFWSVAVEEGLSSPARRVLAEQRPRPIGCVQMTERSPRGNWPRQGGRSPVACNERTGVAAAIHRLEARQQETAAAASRARGGGVRQGRSPPSTNKRGGSPGAALEEAMTQALQSGRATRTGEVVGSGRPPSARGLGRDGGQRLRAPDQ